MLKITAAKNIYLNQCVKLAYNEYKEESNIVKELPQKDYSDILKNLLSDMISNHLGFVALDNNKVVGFLSCYAPIPNFFGKIKGAFSPIHGHGSIVENRLEIYSLLYEHLAEKLVKNEVYSHAISIYSHNKKGIESFFKNGFGMRCVDAITSIDNEELLNHKNENFINKEIPIDEISSVTSLRNLLFEHMWNSPTFFPVKKLSVEQYKKQAINKKARFFVSIHNDEVVAFIELSQSGENFSCDEIDTINICGAYVKPKLRGTGVATSLLSFVFNKMKKENYNRCGVDYESINPSADRFWSKYFTPYTYSLTRRIDERIAEV